MSEDGLRHKRDSQDIKPGTYWASFAMFALVALMILTGGFALGLDPVIAGSDRARRCIEPVALLALTAAAAWLWTTRAPAYNLSFDRAAPAAWPIVCVISIVAFVATAITALYILDEYPMSGDEYAYLFQSWIFELGKLWTQPWPLDKYLDTFFIFNVGGKLLAAYPPGWPAVLAAASTAGIPTSLVNPILAAGTIPVLYVLGLRRYGAPTGLLAVCIFAGSVFFVMNSATFFAVTSLLTVITFGTRLKEATGAMSRTRLNFRLA